MADALIGHSGFVGGHLAGPGREGFNSRNFREMRGRRFGEIVCAGVSAAKYLANRDPEGDAAAIAALTGVLDTVEAERFVLISTIDVYPDPASGADESADPGDGPDHAYGRNRLALERWARARFDSCAIVRLPALFGTGLRKNALFDLLTGNQVEKIDPAGIFQFYPLRLLAGDLDRISEAGADTVNLFPEPVAMRTVIDRFFPDAPVGAPGGSPPRYDLSTRHAGLFGETGRYRMPAGAVLDEMAAFVAAWPR